MGLDIDIDIHVVGLIEHTTLWIRPPLHSDRGSQSELTASPPS
jgi:hypothetical protein